VKNRRAGPPARAVPARLEASYGAVMTDLTPEPAPSPEDAAARLRERLALLSIELHEDDDARAELDEALDD